jgi:hypothetical protein
MRHSVVDNSSRNIIYKTGSANASACGTKTTPHLPQHIIFPMAACGPHRLIALPRLNGGHNKTISEQPRWGNLSLSSVVIQLWRSFILQVWHAQMPACKSQFSSRGLKIKLYKSLSAFLGAKNSACFWRCTTEFRGINEMEQKLKQHKLTFLAVQIPSKFTNLSPFITTNKTRSNGVEIRKRKPIRYQIHNIK